jgi:hypothetical protein
MFYGTGRRLSGAEGLDRRQRLHALPPFPHAGKSAYMALPSGVRLKEKVLGNR